GRALPGRPAGPGRVRRAGRRRAAGPDPERPERPAVRPAPARAVGDGRGGGGTAGLAGALAAADSAAVRRDHRGWVRDRRWLARGPPLGRRSLAAAVAVVADPGRAGPDPAALGAGARAMT